MNYTPAHMDPFAEYDTIPLAHGGAVRLSDGGDAEAEALNKRIEDILASDKEKAKKESSKPSNEMFTASPFLKSQLMRGRGSNLSMYAGIPQKMSSVDIPSFSFGGSGLGRMNPFEQVQDFMPRSKIPNFAGGGALHPALAKLLKERGMNLDAEMIAGPEDRLYAKHAQRGFAVGGAGTGQSDDIPTMLSDGEYVFDADSVSALGDGSSKAGAALLDKMREEIRRHKRGAPVNDIPPKAKSPLSYLKMARKGK